MKEKLSSIPKKVIEDNLVNETLLQINNVTNQNSDVKIYRATIGNSINPSDWIFLSKAQAEKWTKTPFGTPKPGVKVIESTVKAKNVDWTGKNLEFVYIGKRKRYARS